MKNMIVLLIVAGVAIWYACTSTSTEITGSWRDPSPPEASYSNILIAALTSNINAKTTVENDLARELSNSGITVEKSMAVFPPNFTDDNNDKKAMLGKIRDNGADAILTVSLIDKETDSRYVPGTYAYEPIPLYGYYSTFWPYYSYWYPRVYSPGYYVEDKVYYIETNLYDVDTEKLIWSAQSETYNPSSLDKFSREFAKVIANDLRKENILPAGNDNAMQEQPQASYQ